MSQPTRRRLELDVEPVRVLGRGLRAARGVHLTLRILRDAAGKTQLDVARDAQMDQSDISRLETRSDFDDCQVATLRRYVEALGGSFELTARFGDKRISITGIQSQSRRAGSKRVPRPGLSHRPNRHK